MSKVTNYTKEEIELAVDGDWCELKYGKSTLRLRGENVPTECLEEEGGEGCGEYACVIFKVGSQIFRKEGYYASYDGYTWDGDFDEVEPYPKTITAYRVKK